jgi:hypothetical protein
MANGDGGDTRERLLGVLLEKVAADTYPSNTMLDLIEELIEPDDVEAYAVILCEKIAEDTYPSTSLIRRVLSLTQ